MWLGLSSPDQTAKVQSANDRIILPSVASALVKDLDCAVLAMRYPVDDEFAIRLAQEIYEGIIGRGQTLTSALQVAMPNILGDGYDADDYSADAPPLSVATPTLFGGRAASLTIKAPEEDYEAPKTPLAYFPNEPERFVGRLDALGRANKALAPKSKKAGVLFHGIAGAGKSACALELAYHHYRSRRFRAFIWYQAPKVDDEIFNALQNLAVAMEVQIPGFKMIHVVDNEEDFERWLPHLTETLEKSSILVVLDNLESLLTKEGKWHDERWGSLIAALLAQDGQSRVILTSRIKPVEIYENRLQIEPIHAMTLDESLLLAREMPNLGNLLLGRSAIAEDKGRLLVNRTLKLVQGHPKLIELADAQAEDPIALEKYLESATEAWGEAGSKLDRFFQEGESAQTAEEFLNVLINWTKGVSESLPEGSKMLFRVLCALEDDDRLEKIVKLIWPDLWEALGSNGDVPALDQVLSPIKLAGLADPQAIGDQMEYIIHPGVVQAGLGEIDEKFKTVVDSKMASYWRAVFDEAQSGDQEKGQLVIMAGLRSAPYLIRLKEWSEASSILEDVISRDSSPETIASVLPLLRHIAQVTSGTDQGLIDSGILAHALEYAGQWQEAEEMMRSLIPQSISKGNFRAATALAGYLFILK